MADPSTCPQLPSTELDMTTASSSGTSISLIAYGISLVLLFECIQALYRRSRQSSDWHGWLLIGYTCLLFIFSTLYISMNTVGIQYASVDHSNYPGGPVAWSAAEYSSALDIIPNVSFVVANWLADGLLLFRCFVIYTSSRWVVAFPTLMYLGSISMGIMLLYQSSRPTADIFTTVTVNFGLPYFSITTSLNIILTLLISIRLLYHRRNIQAIMGSAHGSPYVSVAAILIESSTLYAVFFILFLGAYAAKSDDLSDALLPILSQVQVIASILIMHRVGNRHAWTSDTGNQCSTGMVFASRPDPQPSSSSALSSREVGDNNGVQLGLSHLENTSLSSHFAPSRSAVKEEEKLDMESV